MKTSKINEIKSIFLLAIALVIFISLLTFDQNDIKFLTSNPNLPKNNVVGFVGAYMAWVCLFLMGFGAYVIPFFIALWGAYSMLKMPLGLHLIHWVETWDYIVAYTIFTVLASVTLYLAKKGTLGPNWRPLQSLK